MARGLALIGTAAVRMPKPLAAALACLALAAGGAAAAEMGTIQFENWPSYQRNNDDSGQWQYDPRVFIPFKLANGWTFTQRFDLPVLYTDQVGADNPTGAWKAGIGDWYVEEIFTTPELAENFKMWGSVRLVFPTGGSGPFGSSQYQWAPAVSASFAMPEYGISVGPVARYFMSYHATEPGASKIRQLWLYPILTFAMQDNWSLAFYSENGIAYNAVTHNWFVPIDLLLSKRVTNTVDVGLGVAYPLTKDDPLYKYVIYGRVTLFF